jgi:tetratricopeptide (TPR) repeat protein
MTNASELQQDPLAAAIDRYQAGDYTEAADGFAALLEQSPDDPTALRLCGLALTRAGQHAKALPLLARARRLAFGDPLTHLHYGIALQDAGCFARAAALFRRTTRMAPHAPAPWINLANALTALRHPKAARAAARRALSLAPDDADALYALGRAGVAAGDPAGAGAAFAAAARARPDFADAWLSLGLARYQLGDVNAAMEAMRAVLTVAPHHGAAEANLCAFMLLRGDVEDALVRLRDLVERDPLCIPARLNLANVLLFDRDAEAALALLDLPPSIAPPTGRDAAHWRSQRALALLFLDRVAEAERELDAIGDPYDAEIRILWRRIRLAMQRDEHQAAEVMAERMAVLLDDEVGYVLEHRIVGHFELAGFHSGRGRKPIAFAHWQNGHRLLARIQPFSRDAHRAFVDASISAFSHQRLHDGPRAATIDAAPVFIVGLPRSGTTLTEQILAAHPDVHAAGERPAIYQLTQRLAGGAHGPAAVHTLAALEQPSLTQEADAFLATLHAIAPNARLIIDKMPANALHLGLIATLLPGARIIHCCRDPRDTGLSIFQHRFLGYHPYAHDLADLGWYIGEHARLMAHWRGALPLPIHEIALTDWVEDFAGTLTRLLAFLDLPHHPACERFYQQPRRVRTASSEQVRRPINASGIGRWREYQEHLAPLLEELQAAGLLP